MLFCVYTVFISWDVQIYAPHSESGTTCKDGADCLFVPWLLLDVLQSNFSQPSVIAQAFEKTVFSVFHQPLKCNF